MFPEPKNKLQESSLKVKNKFYYLNSLWEPYKEWINCAHWYVFAHIFGVVLAPCYLNKLCKSGNGANMLKNVLLNTIWMAQFLILLVKLCVVSKKDKTIHFLVNCLVNCLLYNSKYNLQNYEKHADTIIISVSVL